MPPQPTSNQTQLTKELAPLTKWNDRLAFDVALLLEGSGETMAEILARHNLLPEDIKTYSQDPVFSEKVGHYRSEVRNKGLTFRLKARAQAEELLATSWALIHDRDVSAAVKADLIKSTVKWANLEPKGSEQEGGSTGGGVSITINLGDSGTPPRVIEGSIN